jgi:thiol:disulfide interchange protein
MKRTVLFTLTVFVLTAFSGAQVVKPVKWTFQTRPVDDQHVDLVFKASIKEPWHMYGINIPENGPIPFSITFAEKKGFTVNGKPTQSPKPEIVDDKVFNMKLELHHKEVTFTQRIKKTGTDSIILSGTLEYMTCSDMQCVPGDQDFTFRLAGAKNAAANIKNARGTDSLGKTTLIDSIQNRGSANAPTISEPLRGTDLSAAPAADAKPASSSLWSVLLIAILAGLGALLTPCVYPMIPLTVSFFLRGNKSRSRAVAEALVFGLSIVFIYTMIGVLVAIFKNPNSVNNVTTHWITNLIFSLVFIILAASFFGMFEIMLPASIANNIDQKADKGGFAGAFFMALAMTILSFSCTGPIVGGLLIKASQGQVLEPIVGMAGFSVIFALPFTLFAVFPSWLKQIPKSGGWLNSVKIFFAFIMLAFVIYFLGKIDQAYNLNILTREVFLSIWVIIFGLIGLYFLGKIHFVHDTPDEGIKFPGLLIAIASFSFALVLFSGLFGAELKGLSSLLPPARTRQAAANSSKPVNTLCGTPTYADKLDFPNGLQGYFDLEEALACAKEQGKPVLVDFGGHTCSNCKKMYSEVWSDPRVAELLSSKFIIADLLTDDHTSLPEKEWYTSKSGKVIKTLGKKNQDIQVNRFGSNALPQYIILDANGKEIGSGRYTYDPDILKFIAWLQTGLN